MFDTLSVAQELTATGMQREQADVLAGAIGRAAVHGDHVTPEILRETLRAETDALEVVVPAHRSSAPGDPFPPTATAGGS